MKEIIQKAETSKAEASAIQALAVDIQNKMDEIKALAGGIPDPSPEPEPIPPSDNNLTGLVNIKSLGVKPIDSQVQGYTYKDTYHNRIEINNTNEKVFYLIFATETGEKTFENILTNGNPTTFSFDHTGPYILKNNSGQYILERCENYISAQKLEQYDFSKCVLFIPKGQYVHFQGHGINTLFFFERNQPQLITGEKGAVLLGITNNLDSQIPRIDCKLENLELHNIIPSSGTRTIDRDYYLNNVSLSFGSVTFLSTYILLAESAKSNFFANHLKINSIDIYAGIWIERSKNVIITNSQIKVNHASHPIRINSYENGCIVYKCFANNGTTGIQVSTQRRQLIKNLIISNCTVEGCTEESISIDSFGNNTALSPVIAKSFVDSIEKWNEEGFDLGIKVTLKDFYFVDGNPKDGYKHKKVNADFVGNPNRLLFVVESGSFAYQFSEIEKNEKSGNDLILYIPKHWGLKKGDEIGLHTGALNCVIEGNTVLNARPNTQQPGHAVSFWGDTFNCSIINNRIDNCKQGIHVAGYGSFGVTSPDFWNYTIGNLVKGNYISNCDEDIRFQSLYGDREGFRNAMIDNKTTGKVVIEGQILFTEK